MKGLPLFVFLPAVAFSITLTVPVAAQAPSHRIKANTTGMSAPTESTAPNEWTWVGGGTGVNSKGTFGTLGTPSPTNTPGGVDQGSTWVDGSGNLWLFGGGWLINQMWRFSPSTNEWTWMGGDTVGTIYAGVNDFQTSLGVYGTQGVPAPNNTPGERTGALSWTDHDGNFWLFGGEGYILTVYGSLNDLWEYGPSTNEWTWVSGSNTFACTPGSAYCGTNPVYGTVGVPSAQNLPGGRSNALGFVDAQGNLWMFGGSGTDATGSGGPLNDLWKFNPDTKQWTWMSGPNTANQLQSAVYGTQGVFAAGNMPGVLINPAAWTDNNGHFWLFGTFNGDTELWEFDPSLNEWALMGGDLACTLSCNQLSVFGTLGIEAPANNPGPRTSAFMWTDNTGSLWMFGGYGTQANGIQGSLNELWRFNPNTKQWAWMGGTLFVPDGGPPAAQYGTQGSPWPGNVPGARTSGVTWVDPQGNLWLFGGSGVGLNLPSNQNQGDLNDLWVYQPSTTPLPTTATPVISVPSGSYDTIQTVNISEITNGAIIYYTTDGTEPTRSSPIYTGPINVASNETVQAYATASGCYDSQIANTNYTITNPAYPAPAISSLSPAYTAAPGASFTLTVSGAGFTTASTVYWQETALPTQALSATQVAAQVPASEVISPGISSIQVQNPTPGGGASQTLQFEVDSSYSGGVAAPVFSPSSASVAAGSSATYAVTLPSAATNASAQCLNLPSGAACSYSASAQSLSISTPSTAAPGSYQVTVVFTETLPITAGWLFPFVLSPLFSVGRRRKGRWVTAILLAFLAIAAFNTGCGGGGGGSPITTVTPTQQVTRSGTVTLVIQ
jgi:Chitobiase/beta-hexosaminidase C-terminal domain/Kelch motif/Galactose oxidase, central domain